MQIPGYSSSAQTSLGYFTAGRWLFDIQVRNGSTVIYEGSSEVNISNDNFSLTIFVKKVTTQATGSVVISVTAPTVSSESLSILYTGTSSSAQPISARVKSSSNGITTFEYIFSNQPVNEIDPDASALVRGDYTFTLNHPFGGSGATVAFNLRPGEQVRIEGHLENGVWQVGYFTVKIYNITINTEYEDPESHEKTNNCTVRTNVTSAAAGERVAFYVNPFQGAVKQEVSYTWAGGPTPPPSLEPSYGLYSFIMPEGDVTINAIYSGAGGNIRIEYFRALFEILYNAYSGTVTSFGRSLTGPPARTQYFETKDVKLWFENGKICWHNDNGTFTFMEGSMKEFFKGCNKFTNISLEGINTSNVNNMAGMFQNCSALTSVTFDNGEKDANGKFKTFDTGNVTDMSNMFDGCVALPSVNLAGFDTHRVGSMSKMFFKCYELTSITFDSVKYEEVDDPEDPLYPKNGKFKNFDTSGVTDMSCMFAGWDSEVVHPMKLTSLDVSGFDTKLVRYMQFMFYQCKEIERLDVSGWNTGNVQDMSYMFAGLNEGNGTKLNNLHLTNWNFSSVTTTNRMFDRCQSLSDLKFPPEGTNFASLTTMDHMFSHCTALTPKVFRDIVATWTFAQNPLYSTDPALDGIYGQRASSFFGSHDNTTNNATAARNYIFRDTMTKTDGQHPEYGKFNNRYPLDENQEIICYKTKDGVQLWIGGDSKNAKYAKLTVFESF